MLPHTRKRVTPMSNMAADDSTLSLTTPILPKKKKGRPTLHALSRYVKIMRPKLAWYARCPALGRADHVPLFFTPLRRRHHSTADQFAEHPPWHRILGLVCYFIDTHGRSRFLVNK